MSDSKYVLTVNEKQARVINNALDLFSRILIGQVEEVGTVIRDYNYKKKDMSPEMVRSACKTLKLVAFPELHTTSSYGIHQEEIHDDARVAFDIKQVLRHAVAYDVYPDGGHTVDFIHPSKTSTTEELPKAEVYKVEVNV